MYILREYMVWGFETADDPRAYWRERAAQAEARALMGVLIRATGAYFPAPAVAIAPVDEAGARAHSLEHFARIARAGRRWPGWRPSAHLLRAIAARGLSWADVEARAQ